MSQEALAERCGVSFQQVQKYENGTNRISFSRLVQVARALDCRVADLIAAFDPSEADAVDVDLFSRMRLPGAPELLDNFARLDASARATLLTFVQSVTSR